MKIIDIKWNCDGLNQDELGLPSEVEIPNEVEEGIVADWLSDRYAFNIVDWLSDRYGGNVISFSFTLTDEMVDGLGDNFNEEDLVSTLTRDI